VLITSQCYINSFHSAGYRLLNDCLLFRIFVQLLLHHLRMKKGIVKFFNRKSKFGFIRDSETGTEYYVAGKDINGQVDEGDHVTFELKEEKRGPAAVNVNPEKKAD